MSEPLRLTLSVPKMITDYNRLEMLTEIARVMADEEDGEGVQEFQHRGMLELRVEMFDEQRNRFIIPWMFESTEPQFSDGDSRALFESEAEAAYHIAFSPKNILPLLEELATLRQQARQK